MTKIFVGNLDFVATDSSIRSLFERFGKVDLVSVATDRATGRSRGFAFVEMADNAQAATSHLSDAVNPVYELDLLDNTALR
jgi:cold-inducible RNA-binding protein